MTTAPAATASQHATSVERERRPRPGIISYFRRSREGGNPGAATPQRLPWTPAFAGATITCRQSRSSSLANLLHHIRGLAARAPLEYRKAENQPIEGDADRTRITHL